MRSRTIVLAMLVCLLLLAVPVVAHALQVVITATTTNPITTSTATLGPGIPNPDPCPGTVTLVTTTVTLTPANPTAGQILNVNGFTFTPTNPASPAIIKIEQTGSKETIKWANTTIAAPGPTGVLPESKDPCPCTITIEVSSQEAGVRTPSGTRPTGDFCKKKATGTYAAGGSISGFFTGNPAYISADPDDLLPDPPQGDTYSLVFFAGGNPNLASPLLADAVNTISGGGSGDTPVSLPSSCTNNSACVFTANASNGGSFPLSSISENVKLYCAAPRASPCLPTAGMRGVFNFVTPGDTVTLPVGFGTGEPEVPNPFATFTGTASVTLGKPATKNDDTLVFRGSWFLAPNSDGLACLDEEVGFKFGTFVDAFPATVFHQAPQPGACEANFTDPRGEWHIVINKNQDQFNINVRLTNAELKELVTPVQTLPVQLVIGNDGGNTILVTPTVKK